MSPLPPIWSILINEDYHYLADNWNSPTPTTFERNDPSQLLKITTSAATHGAKSAKSHGERGPALTFALVAPEDLGWPGKLSRRQQLPPHATFCLPRLNERAPAQFTAPYRPCPKLAPVWTCTGKAGRYYVKAAGWNVPRI